MTVGQDSRLNVETSEPSPLCILPLGQHSSACYSGLNWLSIKQKGFTRQQRHLYVECVSCVLCEVTGLEKAASCVINTKMETVEHFGWLNLIRPERGRGLGILELTGL